MKQFLLSTAFLFISYVGVGQCDIPILETQTQIDNFPIDYPGCNSVYNLRIMGGNSITDLTPLSQITSVEQQFTINNCPNLQNLEGLENITFAGLGISISNNNSLTSLMGLEGLGVLTGGICLFQNPVLIDINALNNLTAIVQNINGAAGLSISLNNSLENLSGLENLTIVEGDVNIQSNDLLQNLDSINSLATIEGQFYLHANMSLENLNGLSGLENIEGNIVISHIDSVTNLDGLSNLQSVQGNIALFSNDALTSISGLENINPEDILSNITIVQNILLSECAILPFCQLINNPTITFNVNTNASGCNSRTEIEIECEIVNIPDNNFLNALLNYTPIIDTNSDGNIQFDEAETYTGNLNMSGNVIADFTGLEAFVNITGFNGSGNFMNTLSLEANTAITDVDFSDSPDLESINLKNGNNTAITSFNGVDCPSLQFICVDNVAFAEANFTNIDPQVVFTDACEVLAVNDFNLAETVSVFPNPVLNTLTISIASNFSFIKAEVYSIGGQKLKETSATQVDMSDLSAGIYFVNVITEKGSVTKKIVKH